MAKPTLLEMVQDILVSMEGDEVNSYADTTESTSVANIIKQCYRDLVAGMDLPEHWSLFQLEASGDPLKPVQMSLPTDVVRVEWIQYDIQDDDDTEANWYQLDPVPLAEFLRRTDPHDLSETWMDSMVFELGSEDYEIRYHNDRNPTFYTTPDDNTVLFDAVDLLVDSTLAKAKTRCYGQKVPGVTLANALVFDLDELQQSILFNEAKAQCFLELKQSQNITAERKARKGWVRSQTKKNAIVTEYPYDQLPHYGRNASVNERRYSRLRPR